MFLRSKPRAFGQFDWIVPVVTSVLPSAISAGASLGAAYIAKSGAVSVAEMGQQTQLMGMAVQQRIAQLQLEALQTKIAATTPTPTPVPTTTTAVTLENPGATRLTETPSPTTLIAGFPTWGLILIAGGAIFIFGKPKKRR
jgi:hypothetical protein